MTHKVPLLLLLVLVAMGSSGSFACRCAFLSVEQKFSQAEEVLVVEVTGIESISDTENIAEGRRASYRVLNTLKAGVKFSDYVLEGIHSCAVGFKEESIFLLYINAERTVSICDGSIEVRDEIERSQNMLDEAKAEAARIAQE